MPHARQILGEREDLRVLLGGGDAGFSTQTVGGLVFHLLHLQERLVPAPFQCAGHETI